MKRAVYAIVGQGGRDRGLHRVFCYPSLAAFADPKRRHATGRAVSPSLTFDAALLLIDVLKGRH